MSDMVVFRRKGEEAVYVADLQAGTVSKLDMPLEIGTASNEEKFRGLDLAVASSSREATATFPLFAD